MNEGAGTNHLELTSVVEVLQISKINFCYCVSELLL